MTAGDDRGKLEEAERLLAEANERIELQNERLAEQDRKLKRSHDKATEKNERLRNYRERLEKQTQKLRHSHDKATEKNERLTKYRERVEQQERELAGLQRKLSVRDGIDDSHSIEPENMIWMFGYGRTGSTWLSYMMAEISGYTPWFEPYVGALFGDFYYSQAWKGQLRNKHFILGSQRESWVGAMRSFILDVAEVKFPEINAGEYLIVKEPHGSIGAPLLLESLPESRMVLLVRDPRDVISSGLDAYRRGSWAYERMDKGEQEDTRLATELPDTFVEVKSGKYLQHMSHAVQAYEEHGGPKSLVRYEDLRADALGVTRRMYDDLELPIEEEELGRAVEKHSWEKIPEKEKGEGKFYRKAKPGGWTEDLTGEQIKAINRITEPIIRQFYS